MNIESTWQQQIIGDDMLDKILSNGHFNKLESRMPLKKLRNNLLTGIVIAMLSTVAYFLLCFYISEWLVYVALSILIVFNIFIIAESWKLYTKTPSIIKVSHSLKEEMELHYNSFNRWWKLQQKISLFIYPIAISGGFILGGSVGSGKPAEDFLYSSVMLAILAITILVLMPICYFFSRWMFNHTYGKHLKQLKSTIDELK
jgi:hypothetical protein